MPGQPDDEQWWCNCRERRGPHVHMPNWGADPKYGTMLTALVDTGTGKEIFGRKTLEPVGSHALLAVLSTCSASHASTSTLR